LSPKRILGFVLVIGGILMIIFSHYIKGRVAEGREEIQSAQKKVDITESIFSLHPATKGIGEGVSGAAQGKIEEGEQEASHYAELADWFQIGGIVLIVVGVGVIFLSRKKRKA